MLLQMFMDFIILIAVLLFIFCVLKPLFQKKKEEPITTTDVLEKESKEIAHRRKKVKSKVDATEQVLRDIKDNLNK